MGELLQHMRHECEVIKNTLIFNMDYYGVSSSEYKAVRDAFKNLFASEQDWIDFMEKDVKPAYEARKK